MCIAARETIQRYLAKNRVKLESVQHVQIHSDAFYRRHGADKKFYLVSVLIDGDERRYLSVVSDKEPNHAADAVILALLQFNPFHHDTVKKLIGKNSYRYAVQKVEEEYGISADSPSAYITWE